MDSGDKKTAAATAMPSDVTCVAETTEATVDARRPYEAPRLRHLGSVRELTLGATGQRNDATGGRMQARSSRDFKENVHYLTAEERAAVVDQVLSLKLATYDYKAGLGESPGRHLGFIIEDAPRADFVRADEKVVDVYGLASALAAAVQTQQATIARLEAEVADLKRKLPR